MVIMLVNETGREDPTVGAREGSVGCRSAHIDVGKGIPGHGFPPPLSGPRGSSVVGADFLSRRVK